MLSHPLYRYSFIILLIIDFSYAGIIAIATGADFSITHVQAALVWFVCFYWLPIWISIAVILSARARGINNTYAECLIVILLMIVGNNITDYFLGLMFPGHQPLGIFTIFNGCLWGTMLYFSTRYVEGKRKISIEETARKQAQLETLRYQLNPHFMFNSLNTISSYIRTNPDLADEVLHELADILRYSLDTADVGRIPLNQELSIIRKYIHIEQARFGDRLTTTFDIPGALGEIMIPPLLLQPIVENAIKHNAKQTHLHLKIKAELLDKTLKIAVTDNGGGFCENILAKGYGKGIGMRNLQQRMHQIESGKVKLSNQNGASVLLELKV